MIQGRATLAQCLVSPVRQVLASRNSGRLQRYGWRADDPPKNGIVFRNLIIFKKIAAWAGNGRCKERRGLGSITSLWAPPGRRWT